MHEALRRQYLALLGIEQWLPRGEADPLAAAVATSESVASVATTVPRALAQDAGISASHDVSVVPVGNGATLNPAATAKLAELPGGKAGVFTAAPASPIAPPPVSGAESALSTPAVTATGVPVVLAPGVRVGCSLWLLADGLLLVAALSTPDAPGLTGPEHEMLVRLAAALTPGQAPGASFEFHWPPRGVRLPGLDRAGEAQKALAGLLAERRRQGVRDVLLLGEELSPLLADVCAQQALTLVPAPSPAAMLADQQAKRACWELARPLVRRPS